MSVLGGAAEPAGRLGQPLADRKLLVDVGASQIAFADGKLGVEISTHGRLADAVLAFRGSATLDRGARGGLG